MRPRPPCKLSIFVLSKFLVCLFLILDEGKDPSIHVITHHRQQFDLA